MNHYTSLTPTPTSGKSIGFSYCVELFILNNSGTDIGNKSVSNTFQTISFTLFQDYFFSTLTVKAPLRLLSKARLFCTRS